MRHFVHVSFEREDALRRAKTAKRAVRWNVRRNRATVNSNVGTDVWTSGMNRSARKHDWRKGAVSAAIDNEVDLHREELAIFRNGGLVTCA
jgi:hypothetical protein